MVRTILFQVVSLLATAANAQSLSPCHQDVPGGHPVGYQCQGNSGKIFSFAGDRWDVSTGESWLISGQRAEFAAAPAVCEALDAHLPSTGEFDALTREFRNPETGRLALIFPSKLPLRHSDSYWTSVPFSDALSYIWDPRTGHTNGRYYTDYNFHVVCTK